MAGEAVRATPTGQHQDGNPEETVGKDDEVVDEGLDVQHRDVQQGKEDREPFLGGAYREGGPGKQRH